MKNTKKTATVAMSAPYRTNKVGFIKAPKSISEGEPKVSKIVSNKDLRGGRA